MDDTVIKMQSELGSLVCLKPSKIEGDGLFAKEDIPEGARVHATHIWVSKYGWINLDPNYKFNHSQTNPNSKLVTNNNIKELIVLRNVLEGEELLADYSEDDSVNQPEENWL